MLKINTMAITVTVGELKPQEKPYPKLMISQDGDNYTIILATDERLDGIEGVCVESNQRIHEVGERGPWRKLAFKDLNRTLMQPAPVQQEKPFPKLMQRKDGTIAHFMNNQMCYLLTGRDEGLYIVGLDITQWSDCNEPLTLQNA